jgi:uncharacterized protein YbjT (DUF2867 family)
MSETIRHVMVFGATGKTGQHIIRQSLGRGLTVTAVVRDPAKLATSHPNLKAVQADIGDTAAIDTALASRPDAVISALGIYQKEPGTALSTGTGNIVKAMAKHGVRRLVVVSSLGAGDSRGQGSLLARGLQKFLLRHVLDDKTRQEDIIARSNVVATVFRPPQLTDDERLRDDLVLWSGPPPKQRLTWKVSRATVAKYVLDAAQTGQPSGAPLNMSEPA